ncbi:MAG: hypothetical protein Q8T11_12050 [Elusimicrobiota bacterium]|nr:hypothetical protein [Elusimicrobiota bacterium]
MAPLSAAVLLGALAAGASAADPAVDPAKLRASHATIAKTSIPLYELVDQSDQGMQWSMRNTADVGEALEAASRAIATLYARHPSAVADAYGNGTMTNIEDTMKLFGGGDLERGCISHQFRTFDAASARLAGSSLTVKKVRIGTILQHNAVVIFPTGKDWKQSGIVLDAWLKQKADLARSVYTFKDWVSFGDRPRLLKDDE